RRGRGPELRARLDRELPDLRARTTTFRGAADAVRGEVRRGKGRMAGEYDERDMGSVIDAFQQQMRAIAEAQQQRVRLTAAATSRDKLVTVTVNANGVVIETRFASGIERLSYDEIAATVTRTAQQAAADVA